MIRALLGSLVLFLALSPATSAQTLRGRLTTPAGLPVPAALFTLLAENGEPLGTTVSNTLGEFSFESAPPGRHMLRVERIGQATLTGEPFVLEPDADLTLTLHVQSQPAGLPEERVASAPCVAGGPAGAVASFWAAAARALRIRLLSEQLGQVPVSGVRYVRMLDAAYRVKQGIIDEEPFSGVALPFPAVPAEAGFAAADSTGTLQYLVPSPAVLLSRAFSEHHCIHEVVPDPQDGNRVGLRFRPLRGSEVPGVEGTLWLERSSGDVALLEYEYRAQGNEVPREVRGMVDFATSADGVPLVSRWWLRVPRVFETTRGVDRQGERNTVLVESGALAFGSDNQPLEDPEGLFPLMTGVITLDAVVVAAKRTSFEAELEAKPWHWTRSATSVVRPAEILGAPQSNALDIVRALRAQWLVPVPGRTGQPSVYLDNMRMTDRSTPTEDALRAIPASQVGAIERIRSIEAAMLYGAIDIGANGVIVVYSRRW